MKTTLTIAMVVTLAADLAVTAIGVPVYGDGNPIWDLIYRQAGLSGLVAAFVVVSAAVVYVAARRPWLQVAVIATETWAVVGWAALLF